MYATTFNQQVRTLLKTYLIVTAVKNEFSRKRMESATETAEFKFCEKHRRIVIFAALSFANARSARKRNRRSTRWNRFFVLMKIKGMNLFDMQVLKNPNLNLQRTIKEKSRKQTYTKYTKAIFREVQTCA